MALRLLGEPPIDIHCGGVDLIFPHHENEIAQSEGATNKQFARFWMHVEHLLIDEEKMSKSLGNVFNLPDIQAKGYRASTLRYLLLSTHYRKQLKFSWETMDQADEAAPAPCGLCRTARSSLEHWITSGHRRQSRRGRGGISRRHGTGSEYLGGASRYLRPRACAQRLHRQRRARNRRRRRRESGIRAIRSVCWAWYPSDVRKTGKQPCRRTRSIAWSRRARTRANAGIFPKGIESASSCSKRGSCSRIRRAVRDGNGSRPGICCRVRGGSATIPGQTRRGSRLRRAETPRLCHSGPAFPDAMRRARHRCQGGKRPGVRRGQSPFELQFWLTLRVSYVAKTTTPQRDG